MDSLIKQSLHASELDRWLDGHSLGFLTNKPILESISLIIGTVIVYYAGRVFISYGIRHIIRQTARHRAWHKKDLEKREKTLISLMLSFWRIVIIIYLVAMLANKLFSFDLSPLFASAGIIGVAIGFGSQSLVKDFLTGVFIISENQYRVGDVVDIMGSVGTVERIGSRSTVLRDRSGNVHYIPNGTIQKVINKTMDYSIAIISLVIPSDSDISQVVEIINQTGEEMSKDAAWKRKIINSPSFSSIGDVTDKGVEITITAKTMPSDQWTVGPEMRSRLRQALEKSKIEFSSISTTSGDA